MWAVLHLVLLICFFLLKYPQTYVHVFFTSSLCCPINGTCLTLTLNLSPILTGILLYTHFFDDNTTLEWLIYPDVQSFWIICHAPPLSDTDAGTATQTHKQTHRRVTQASQLLSFFSGLTSFPSSVFHFILLLPWLKGIKPCPQPYSLQSNTHTHIHIRLCHCGLSCTHYNETDIDKQTNI